MVLAGEGRSFCAGADIGYMRETAGLSYEENLEDARRLAMMFWTIDECPKPVVAKVQGVAMGGGAGLLAVADVVVADSEARFAFSEIRLGIAPATISPFVVRKIGVSHARSLFLTGERFDAERAREIGLVHRVVSSDGLDESSRREGRRASRRRSGRAGDPEGSVTQARDHGADGGAWPHVACDLGAAHR